MATALAAHFDTFLSSAAFFDGLDLFAFFESETTTASTSGTTSSPRGDEFGFGNGDLSGGDVSALVAKLAPPDAPDGP